jgi:phosphatidylglycerophosphate synthase
VSTAPRTLRHLQAELGRTQEPAPGVTGCTRRVDRPLGRVVAAVAVRRGVGATTVTVVSALLSCAGLVALVGVRPSPASSALVAATLLGAHVLDASDGQVARLTGTTSRAGEWLGDVVDASRQVALHVAVLLAVARFADLPQPALLVPAVLAIAVSTRWVAQVLAERLRTAEAPGHDAGTLRSVLPLPLPVDTGVMGVTVALLPWPTTFVAVYSVLAACAVLLCCADLRRRYVELASSETAGVVDAIVPGAEFDDEIAIHRWPTISVVVPTVDRPVLLRRALTSILEQDYPAHVEVVVVHDRTTAVHPDVDVPANRTLVVIENVRTPGLAGTRNSGILHATGDHVAFCDDDDVWLPGKLVRQVHLWARSPRASAIASSITIGTSDGSRTVRHAPRRTTLEDLLRSRVTELHPSSFLVRRADLLGPVGLVDEALPCSYGEDYDLLLRLARTGDVHAVSEPSVYVDWARTSYFSGRWDSIAEGLIYILDKFPEFATDRRGTARIEGQVAFALAAQRRRAQAFSWARSALAHDWRQRRAYAALAVGSGLLSAEWLVARVENRGRGL